MLPLDLHVLSLPLAFILSQDQTLLCISFLYSLEFAPVCFPKEINALYCLYLSFIHYFQSTSVSWLLRAIPAADLHRPYWPHSIYSNKLFRIFFRNGLQRYALFYSFQIFLTLFFSFFIKKLPCIKSRDRGIHDYCADYHRIPHKCIFHVV